MAFEAAPQRILPDWVCLNTDVAGLPNLGHAHRGETCLVMDTGVTYVYSGSGTTWYALPTPSAPVLAAGSAIVGKVGIDQTTPGTTNGVAVNQGPADRAPVHTNPTATNATSAMLAANAARKAALLTNIGSVDVFIKLGAAAVASQGIYLQANGGSFSMSDMLGNLDNAAINGITASGTAVVLVTEWS
jgi:hypothetical protein